jgi:CRP/FNR family transcriptional regulator, cyclic AMP receptor protein
MNLEQEKTAPLSMSQAERLHFLQEVPIFKEINNPDFLAQLAANLEEEIFPANHNIFTKGEAGHLLYILVSGSVQVHLDSISLAKLEVGAYFGEMALFDAQPRSASVTTLQPSKCLVLTRQQIHQAIRENPGIAINMIRVLVARVRKLNRLFGSSEDLFYFMLKEKTL